MKPLIRIGILLFAVACLSVQAKAQPLVNLGLVGVGRSPAASNHADAVTRGGRTAYELQFAVTNHTALLTTGHTYLVGFFARCSSSANGLLYVPTSSHAGDSDVQAGNTVIGGLLNIADAGGPNHLLRRTRDGVTD